MKFPNLFNLFKRPPPVKRQYSAANINRLTSDWITSGLSADSELYKSLRLLRNRSRELCINNDYARRFLKRTSTNVIGNSGIRLQVRAVDNSGNFLSGINNQIMAQFESWSKKNNCSVDGRLSWIDSQRLFLESVARDGEVIIRLVKGFDNGFGFALQFIEADHLDEELNKVLDNGNYIRMGIEFNKWNRPVAYHLLTSHPGELFKCRENKKYQRIPAGEIIHAFIIDRPSQSRGVPWMHSAMLRLRMLAGYEEAELVAARVGASKMGFFVSPDGSGYLGNDDGRGNKLMEAEPGTYETTRINEILTLGDKHNMKNAAMEFIREGKSLDAFRQKILENLSSVPLINTSSPDQTIIGMSEKETRNFSIIKAIKAAVAGNWQGAELEREASTEIAKRVGREPASFFIPLDVMLEKRDLQKLVNTAGGYLVPTDYLSSNFIELLRNKMLIHQMGAKVMSGLHGDIAIPKQMGGATAFWVAEGESPQKSQQTFGQVTLSPKSIAAYTDFSRKLILQASPDIEQLVREDLATTIALEIDRAAINGSGKGAEPLGILNHKIAKVNIGDEEQIDWDKIVDLETAIAAKNADIGGLGYLCNAALRGHLKQTEKAEHTAQFIWESKGADSGFGYLNGYRVGTTNQMPADTLLFGNFADLIIGQWGVLDVLVDPYALGTSGGIRIRLMQDIDIAIRHAESFAVARK